MVGGVGCVGGDVSQTRILLLVAANSVLNQIPQPHQGAQSKRRQVKTATGHNGDNKTATATTATQNLEPSQNCDNNESTTATNNICLSVIANRIIGHYSV